MCYIAYLGIGGKPQDNLKQNQKRKKMNVKNNHQEKEWIGTALVDYGTATIMQYNILLWVDEL